MSHQTIEIGEDYEHLKSSLGQNKRMGNEEMFNILQVRMSLISQPVMGRQPYLAGLWFLPLKG